MTQTKTQAKTPVNGKLPSGEDLLKGNFWTPEDTMEHYTDLGNGRRLARLYGQDLRYTQAHGWLVWDGKRWKCDETGEVMRLAKRAVLLFYSDASSLARKAAGLAHQAEQAANEGNEDKASELAKQQADAQKGAKELQAWAKKSQSRSRLEAMIALAQSEPPISTTADQLDADPWLLNVQNGTIDLRTGELHPHRREDLLTKLAPAEYDPEAICPNWILFIDRIFSKDDALKDFVQRAVGYSLTAITTEQKLFFAYGSGQNGKSTFFETMAHVLGDYWQKAPTEMIMAKDRGGSVPNDVARLAGVRMVVCAEVEDGHRLAESKVKDLTGGDTLTARFMRQNFFDFRPTHKLWIYGNHKPTIRGTDTGIWRRIRLIPFVVTIPESERNPYLLDNLKTEAPGILAWAVQGCRDWQDKGLPMPDAVKVATEDYKAESDVLGAFLEECCITGQNNDGKPYTAQAGQMFKVYKQWCKQNGERDLSMTRFGRLIVERGFEKSLLNGRFHYQGIGLTRLPEPDDSNQGVRWTGD